MSVCERSIPDIIRNICQQIRVDGGQRLMKRANRHAVDPRSPQLLDATAAIKTFESKTCIEITTNAQASMKDDVYTNIAAFGNNSLLYCECLCKAGSSGNEKIVCVHTPSIGVMLSYFLMDEHSRQRL